MSKALARCAVITLVCAAVPAWAVNNNGWDTGLIYGLPAVSGGGNSDGGQATTVDVVTLLPATSGTVSVAKSAGAPGHTAQLTFLVDSGAGGDATFAGLTEQGPQSDGVDPFRIHLFDGNGVTATPFPMRIVALIPPAESPPHGGIKVEYAGAFNATVGMRIQLLTSTVNALMAKPVGSPGATSADGHFAWTPVELGRCWGPEGATSTFQDPVPGTYWQSVCFSGRGANDARQWRVSASGPYSGGGRTGAQGFTVSEIEPGTGYELRRASVGQILGGADLFLTKGDPGCLRYNAKNNTLILSFNGQITDATILGAGGLNRAADTHKQFYAVEFELANCPLGSALAPLAGTVVDGAQASTRRIIVDNGSGADATFSNLIPSRLIRFNPSGQIRRVLRIVTKANTGFLYPGHGILIVDRPVTVADNETISRYPQGDGATPCNPPLRELYEGPKSPADLPQAPGIDVDENGILYMTGIVMDVDNPGNFGGPDVVSFDTSVVGASGGALSSNDSPFPSNIATNVLVGGIYKRLIDGGNANTCDNPVISQVTCNYKNPRLIAWRQPPTFNGPGPQGNLVMAQYNCDGPACNNDAVQLKRGLEFDEDAIDSNSDLVMLGHDTVEGDHGEKVIGTGGIPSNNKKQDNRNRLAIRGQRTSWGGILLACERGSLGGQKIYWPNVISYPDPVGNVLEGAMVRYEWYGGTTDADRCGGLWDAAMPWGSGTAPDLSAACCQPGGAGCSNLLASQCSAPNHAQLDGQTCEQLVEHGNENSPPNPGCDLFCSTPNYADANGDGHVDMNDFAFFQRCYSGSGHAVPALPYCLCFDRGSDSPGDNDIDQFDFGSFVACAGRTGTAPPNCP